MLYPVYIHVGDANHAHVVTIPDFPGCFSAAVEWQVLPRMIQEAIELWCEGQSLELHKPSDLDTLVINRVHSKTQKPRIRITFCEEINWRCYVPPLSFVTKI